MISDCMEIAGMPKVVIWTGSNGRTNKVMCVVRVIVMVVVMVMFA